MAAKYLVMIPPGAYVPEVGFIPVGSIFTGPDGYVPSKTFRPVNDEAAATLKKLGVEAEVVAIRKEEPKIEAGLSLRELGELSSPSPHSKADTKGSRKL